MTPKPTNCNIIFGISSLEGWLGISRPVIYDLIKLGLPCDKLNKTWVFHKDNINDWFKGRSFNIEPKDPEDAK